MYRVALVAAGALVVIGLVVVMRAPDRSEAPTLTPPSPTEMLREDVEPPPSPTVAPSDVFGEEDAET